MNMLNRNQTALTTLFAQEHNFTNDKGIDQFVASVAMLRMAMSQVVLAMSKNGLSIEEIDRIMDEGLKPKTGNTSIREETVERMQKAGLSID